MLRFLLYLVLLFSTGVHYITATNSVDSLLVKLTHYKNNTIDYARACFEVGQAYQYNERCDTCDEQALHYYFEARKTMHNVGSEVLSSMITFDFPGMLNDLGILFADRGEYERAMQMYQEALSLSPRLITALSNLASIYVANGLWQAAEQCFENAVNVSQTDPTIQPTTTSLLLYNFGVLLYQQKKFSRARSLWQRAIEFEPHESYLAQANLALLSCEAEHGNDSNFDDDSTTQIRGAMLHEHANPLLMESYLAFGVALDLARTRNLGHYFVLRLQQASTLISPLPPSGARALLLRSLYLSLLDDIEHEAVKYFDIGILPKGGAVLKVLDVVGCSGLGYPLIYGGFNDIHIRQRLAQVMWTLSSATLSFAAPHILPAHSNAKPHSAPGPGPELIQRVKVGFISAYWYHHSVGLLLQEVIRGLDRSVFDVHLIILGMQEERFDYLTWDLINSVESNTLRSRAWSRTLHLPFPNLSGAQMEVAALKLDILVYGEIGMDPLTYFLSYGRYARRSLLFWGHAITSGITISGSEYPLSRVGPDYFISSALFEPEIRYAQQRYSERLLLMRSLTTVFKRPVELQSMDISIDSDPVKRRAKQRAFLMSLDPQLELPKNLHVYSLPQTLYKLHPDLDTLLLHILQADPLAVLILCSTGSGGREGANTWSRAVLTRLPDGFKTMHDRIVLLRSLSTIEFLALLHWSDVVLDPFPVGGGRSSFESFSVSAPIVMLYPRTSILQLTYAMYRTMGFTFSEPLLNNSSDPFKCCICRTAACYVTQAVQIAANYSLNQAIRAAIRANHDALFDVRKSGVLEEWKEVLLRVLAAERPVSNPTSTSTMNANNPIVTLIHQSPSTSHHFAESLGFIPEEWRALELPYAETPISAQGPKWMQHTSSSTCSSSSHSAESIEAGLACLITMTNITAPSQLRQPRPPLDPLQVLFVCSSAALSTARLQWDSLVRLGINGADVSGSPTWGLCQDFQTGCIDIKAADDLGMALRSVQYFPLCLALSSASAENSIASSDGSGTTIQPSLATTCTMLSLPGKVNLQQDSIPMLTIHVIDTFVPRNRQGLAWAIQARVASRRKWLLDAQRGDLRLEAFDSLPSSESGKFENSEKYIMQYDDRSVTLAITTSKRLELFQRTSAALVAALPCLSLSLSGGDIGCLVRKVLVVDDRSSDDDRRAMMQLNPNWTFAFFNDSRSSLPDGSTKKVNGHARSMNYVISNVHTRYLLYLEDDWLSLPKTESGPFLLEEVLKAALHIMRPSPSSDAKLEDEKASPYSPDCREVVSQVLFNEQTSRECAEGRTSCEMSSVGRGGWPRLSSQPYCHGGQDSDTEMQSFRYLVHEFGLLDEATVFSYWPGLSFNPGLWDLRAIVGGFEQLGIGPSIFNEADPHFEQRFAVSALMAGLTMAYLPAVAFAHIGHEQSAYALNNFTRRFDAAPTPN